MKKIKTLDDFIKKLFNPKYDSIFTAVIGPNQTGKTKTALWKMIRCYELGLINYFGANIPDLELPFKYDFIQDLPTLKERCQMLNPNPKRYGIKRYLFLADEMGDWAPKDQAWLNVEFIRELQKVRKYGLSLIGTGIDRIDSRILSPSFFHGYLRKRSKNQPDKGVYTDWTRYPILKRYQISTLPDTKINGFDTWYPAVFYMKRQLNAEAIPLSEDHKIVKKYLLTGSWKASGIRTQEGKRALFKILEHHFTHCLTENHIKLDPLE